LVYQPEVFTAFAISYLHLLQHIIAATPQSGSRQFDLVHRYRPQQTDAMPRKSKYTIVVDNLSSITRSRDIKKEMEYAGKVLQVERDPKSRCALVEFAKSDDAAYAWKKMEGFEMDGRKWKVDYANKDDYKFFKWKWTEDTPSPSPARSPSRSPSRSASPAPRKD